jgi:hypothetical protein
VSLRRCFEGLNGLRIDCFDLHRVTGMLTRDDSKVALVRWDSQRLILRVSRMKLLSC